jgi:hypothetical protein
MKIFRLSTLLLLVVIAALCFALGVQDRRAARRDAELRAKIAQLEEAEASREWIEMNERRRLRHAGFAGETARSQEPISNDVARSSVPFPTTRVIKPVEPFPPAVVRVRRP